MLCKFKADRLSKFGGAIRCFCAICESLIKNGAELNHKTVQRVDMTLSNVTKKIRKCVILVIWRDIHCTHCT